MLAAVVAAWSSVLVIVPVWMQAVVVQLGDPVRTLTEPGLYLKLPLIQEVLYFDKRLLDYEASPKEILTKDKQQLVVDNYSRWRIDDPLQLYRTVRNEAGAQSRLDDIVYSDLRETLGRHTLREIVSEQRSALMEEVTAASDQKARAYGIRVIDVRIKRADLPEKNELNVFNRMRTERERQAKRFRAEGEEESRKVRSDADKQVRILTADARQKADIARGEGDAQAVKIFADAYGRDPILLAPLDGRLPQDDRRGDYAHPLDPERVLPVARRHRARGGAGAMSLLAVLAATLFVFLYLRSPIDQVPDRFGAIGLLDDLVVLLVAAWWVRSRLRARVPVVRPEGPSGPWDPYAVLGVGRAATREEITRAYREQMRRYHPDRVADLGPELRDLAHEKTLEIQRAYAELG